MIFFDFGVRNKIDYAMIQPDDEDGIRAEIPQIPTEMVRRWHTPWNL